MFSKFQVHFTHAKDGYLYYEIQYGNIFFKNEFDAAFDPIMDLKNWLEEISRGLENQNTIRIENGGELIHFLFKEVQNKGFLFLSDYHPNKPILQIPTTRKELVRNFYRAVIDFSNSPKYEPKEWERIYLKDLLCKDFGGVNEEVLVKMLLCMNRENLLKVLFKTKKWSVSYQFKANRIKYIDSYYFANHFTNALPKNYDELSELKKEEIILNWLNQIVNQKNWNGTSLREFKSEIIEEFLFD